MSIRGAVSLIERDELLETLAGLYSASVDGHGRVALVSGGVASGKTELVATCVQRLAEAGALVLSAAGSLAESTIQLGVVGQLCQAAGLPAGILDDAAGLPGEPTLRRTDARTLDTVCRTFLDLAGDRPLVLAVDDIQFADPLSLQALLYLQRRIGTARVLLVLTGCSGPQPVSAAFRAELIRQPHCRELRLRPLSRDGVNDLLAQRLDRDVADELTAPVHILSGGNPMLVRALVEDYLAAIPDVDPGGLVEPVVGSAFTQAVLACLHRGDPQLLDVARALAVAGPRASAALLDSTPAAVNNVLSALDSAGLTDAGSFRHPVVRNAILADCPPELHTRLRRRAARLLHEDGAPAAEVAEHLIAAGESGEEWAVPVLTAAAETALAGDDVPRAVDCLEQACRTSRAEPERAALTAKLVRALWRTNPAAVARHLSPLCQAFEHGYREPADAVLLATSLVWYGRPNDAEHVLGSLTEPADPDLAGEYRAVAEWLRHGAPSEQDSDRAEQVLQRCRIGETALVAVTGALHALIRADRLDRATYWCDVLLGEAEARRITSWRAVLADVRASIALRLGDLDAAQRHARSALAGMSAQSWGVAIGSPLSNLVLATTMAGKLTVTAELLAQGSPPAMRHSRFWPRYLQARGTYYLAVDRLHAALADFQAAGELGWPGETAGPVPWRVNLARVHLRMGHPDRARALVGDQPAGDGDRIRGMCLRVLAAASEPKRRQALLRQAVDLLQDSGDRYELAHAFADLAEAGQALGEFNRARMMGRHAMQLAKDCHAEPLYQRLLPSCDAPERTDDSRAVRFAVLSDAERRVVNLAARGHTNREIGRKLYITVSTVEQHLTRAYRKLKISRRTDLLPSGPLEMEAYA